MAAKVRQTTIVSIASSSLRDIQTPRSKQQMKLNRLAVPVLALALGTTGLVMAQPYGVPQEPPPPGYGPGGWDAPPPEFRDIQRQGFHDGVEGARKDFDNHRPPNVN